MIGHAQFKFFTFIAHCLYETLYVLLDKNRQ